MSLLDGTMDDKPEVALENKDLLDMSPQERYMEIQCCIAETNVLFHRRRDAEEIQRWYERNFAPSPEAAESALQLLKDLIKASAEIGEKALTQRLQ